MSPRERAEKLYEDLRDLDHYDMSAMEELLLIEDAIADAERESRVSGAIEGLGYIVDWCRYSQQVDMFTVAYCTAADDICVRSLAAIERLRRGEPMDAPTPVGEVKP